MSLGSSAARGPQQHQPTGRRGSARTWLVAGSFALVLALLGVASWFAAVQVPRWTVGGQPIAADPTPTTTIAPPISLAPEVEEFGWVRSSDKQSKIKVPRLWEDLPEEMLGEDPNEAALAMGHPFREQYLLILTQDRSDFANFAEFAQFADDIIKVAYSVGLFTISDLTGAEAPHLERPAAGHPPRAPGSPRQISS